jgi:LysM repeat protein
MKLNALLSVAVLSLPFGLQAASSDRSGDYEQARKIAARDPKVRAAYEAADRKLESRIVEIDPTLKGYKSGQAQPAKKAAAKPAAKAKPTAKAKPAAKAKPTAKAKPAEKAKPVAKAKPAGKAKPVAKAKPAPAKKSATHIVAKGETLSGIAARNNVSVAALKSANGIKDESKLAVGQKLVIPHGKAQTATAHHASKPPEKKSDSFWSKLGF